MADEPTREDLLEQAGELEIKGRHQMNKDELEKAINAALSSDSGDDASDQDEGSQVSDEDQEQLAESSDQAAEEEDVQGETGTDVSDVTARDADPTNAPPQAAPETANRDDDPDNAGDGDGGSDDDGDDDGDTGSNVRGVGFRR